MERMTVPARVEKLEEVFAFVDRVMDGAEINAKTQNNIKVAVEEIFVNIASYSYPAGEGDVSVYAAVTRGLPSVPGIFSVTFTDSGTPYNPLDKADPDTSLPLMERPIGGLGILMVKKLMDTVRYRYENGKNILMLEKII
jgi:anti-sigma regulatory factor (Ser/Thr protein kinase)